MSNFFHIFAATTLADTTKSRDGQWVVGVIVILIWVISAIANGANKKKEADRRRAVRAELGTPIAPAAFPVAPAPPPLPMNLAPEIQRRVPRERPKPAPPVVRRGKPGAKPIAGLASPAKPPLPTPVRPAIGGASSAMTQMVAPISEMNTAATRAETVSVNATALHRWLQPATLRQQFFVTEVLQPPVALRQNWLG